MAVSITLSITQNSQSIEKNTSNVTVTVTAKWTNGSWNAQILSGGTPQAHGSLTIDGTSYTFRSTFNTGHTTSGSQTIFTKTVDVSHNSDGAKTLSCSASYSTYVSSGTVSCSGSKTLTTIPRKSTLTVANGTLDTAQTLTVTRKATSFTHTIVAKCGSASTTICTKSTSTSIGFTPPISWASQNTTGTSVSVTYTITTYNGSTSIGSNSYTKTCSIPSSVKPSCSLTVTDAMGYADTYGGYLKGFSKFKVVVTATTSHGSAIATYKTTANGATYTASSFTTGTLASHGTLTVSATVTDKRNRSGSTSKSLTVLDYAAPKIASLSVHRCDTDGTNNDQGEYVKVVFSGTVTSLNSKNSAKYVLKYKKTTDSSYTSVTLTNYADSYSVSNATYIFAAETGSSYDVQIAITDDLKTTTRNTSASTAFTLMHFSAGGTGVGIGKVSEAENLLDIGIPVRFREGIESKLLWSGGYYMTADHTVQLSEAISKQPSGIVLVFSGFSAGATENHYIQSFFVPKYVVSAIPGGGHTFILSTNLLNVVAAKYLYISDNTIKGADGNNATGTGTGSGIVYNNARFVLRYVIGV